MCSVRVEELKSFCEFAGNHYNKLLQRRNTRFLSLFPSIERILSMFDGLRAYFLSQEKCPVMLRNIFQNPCLKLWLSFARDQVSIFQACIGQIQKGNISATEVQSTPDIRDTSEPAQSVPCIRISLIAECTQFDRIP